jgi:hypothetical protein
VSTLYRLNLINGREIVPLLCCATHNFQRREQEHREVRVPEEISGCHTAAAPAGARNRPLPSSTFHFGVLLSQQVFFLCVKII